MSSRLEFIASMASGGRGIADIGTDHAILPIMLRRGGYNGYIAACDINEGPLKKAHRGLYEAGIDDVELVGNCKPNFSLFNKLDNILCSFLAIKSRFLESHVI